MKTKLTPDHFSMQYDADHRFEFIESEDATIMAWGHRDVEPLLDEVLAYDLLADDRTERHDAAEVRHLWAVQEADTEDGWWISWNGVTEATPKAVAVTVIER